MIQRSCQILTNFFRKKSAKYTKRYFEKGYIILTLDENYLMQEQELTLAIFVESFVLDHWITLVMRLRQVGLSCLNVLGYMLNS